VLQSTKLRVGWVGYINALPFTLPFELGKVGRGRLENTYAPPTALNELLQQKKLDIALTSCVECLDGEYHLLPGFGIASAQNVMSVNLYTRFSPSTLNGALVGLTPHSATASALLRVLCRHFWKVDPNFELLNQEYTHYTAFLLIGDEALHHLSIPGYQTIDLAAAWYEMTGLPFVFALFVSQKEVDINARSRFQNQLNEALQWGKRHPNEIAHHAQARCPLSLALIRQYYGCLHYRLGENEREGLQTFNKLRKDVPAVCT
jgi:predicted solute-binding protein